MKPKTFKATIRFSRNRLLQVDWRADSMTAAIRDLRWISKVGKGKLDRQSVAEI